MDDETAGLAAAIGERVRRHRTDRRLTLDQLAAAAGVSRRMLVNVEQGATNASVGTLLRLAGALRVGLPALVEPPPVAPVRVTRRGEGAVLWQGGDDARGVLVATGEGADALELWDWRLAPGDGHEADAHTAGTRELLHVHAGAVELAVGDERVTLRAGDAAAFPGDVPHAYRNAGRGSARFSLTVHEPVPEAAP